MQELPEQRLREIESRLTAVSKGPWFLAKDGDNNYEVCCGTEGNPSDTFSIIERYEFEDYNFIAHARQDVPDLLREVKRLNKLLESLLIGDFV